MALPRRVWLFALAATARASCAHTEDPPQVSTSQMAVDNTSGSWRPYLTTVKDKNLGLWSNPCLPDAATGGCDYQVAEVTIVAEVRDDGQLGAIRVAKSSGMRIDDDTAVKAVTQAAPFNAIPEDMKNASHPALRIQMRFNYFPPSNVPKAQ